MSGPTDKAMCVYIVDSSLRESDMSYCVIRDCFRCPTNIAQSIATLDTKRFLNDYKQTCNEEDQ